MNEKTEEAITLSLCLTPTSAKWKKVVNLNTPIETDEHCSLKEKVNNESHLLSDEYLTKP